MNTNIRIIPSIVCLILLLTVSNSLKAQKKDAIFKEVSNAEAVLSTSELSKYTNLSTDPIKEKKVIEIANLEQILQESSLAVSLQGINHSIGSARFSKTKEGTFTFKASFTEAMGELYLYQTNGYLYGNIHIDSLAYQIEPINNKYAVLLRRDYSQYEACPLGETHDEGVKEKASNSQQSPKGKSVTNPTVDVMVLFTNQAAAATSNMQALAEGAIQSSNTSFSNSNAGVTFNLIHYQQVSYNESNSTVTDLNRLKGTSDGHMDNIHSLRDQHGADVVVLLAANYSGSCGRAAEIGAVSSEAFAVTRDDCAIGNYSFAHEIGHLAGARHDSDPNSSPYAYGHGFRYTPAYWRTIMGVQVTSVFRVPYWSNPDVYYGGVAMGSSSWRDNARVWDVRANTMAGFKTPPPITPIASISGPITIQTNQNYTYNAIASSGAPPYTYSWAEQASQNSPWVNIGTGSSILYGSLFPGQRSLRVIVTDSNYETGADVQNIVITSGGGGCVICKQVALPSEFVLSKNYPNPFNPSTQVNFELPETADVSIKVYNIVGQEVATLVNEQMQAGFHNATFEADNLASGLYIARLTASGSSGEQFVSEIKMQLIK
jgi:hypothetical protein